MPTEAREHGPEYSWAKHERETATEPKSSANYFWKPNLSPSEQEWKGNPSKRK